MNQEELKPCPLCGKENMQSSPRTFYHEGICSLSNRALRRDEWNGFFCWKEIDKFQEAIRALKERNREIELAAGEISGRNVTLHSKIAELEEKLKQKSKTS